MPSSGNPTWADGSGGGTPIAATNLNNIETALTGSVAKAGDTMTGNLTVSRTGADADVAASADSTHYAEIVLEEAGSNRWKIRKENDSTPSLQVVRYNASGVLVDMPLVVDFASGNVDFADGATGASPSSTDNSTRFVTSQWSNSGWKSALALPLTATYYYRTGMNTSSVATVNGFAYAMVFVAGRTTNINRLAVNVATAGSTGAVIRLALVEVTNPDTRAWTLISDLGTVAATTTGAKELTGTIPVTQGKVYAVLAISQGAATTQPVLTYCIPGAGGGFGCTTNTSAITNAVPTFSVSGITGAVGASGTGTETSLSWACVVRADT